MIEGNLTALQSVMLYVGIVGSWFMLVAGIGHGARKFVGASGHNFLNDACLTIMGATLIALLAPFVHLELGEIASRILGLVPGLGRNLAYFGEFATAGFVGACALRWFFGLTD